MNEMQTIKQSLTVTFSKLEYHVTHLLFRNQTDQTTGKILIQNNVRANELSKLKAPFSLDQQA